MTLGNDKKRRAADEVRATMQSMSLVEQLHDFARAGAFGIWERVSHLHSANHSVGSRRAQGVGQVALLSEFGLDTAKLQLHSVVETAKANADRPQFRQLLAKVRRGDIRVVVCLFADRLARNQADADELFAALRSVGGLVIVGGQIYDPSDHSQLTFLRLQAVLAQQDNAQRTLRFLISRAALAREGNLQIALPAGLVWADPTSPAYKEAAEEAKLLAAVEKKLDQHECGFTTRDGRTRRIVFLPDADVHKAIRLRHKVLTELRDLRAVFDFIANDSDWPVKGHMPVAGGFTFGSRSPSWKPLGHFREDGKAESLLRQIRAAVAQPALFGTYRWAPDDPSLVPRSLRHLVAPVEMEAAYPSFFPPEELETVREILEPRARPHKRRRPNEAPDDRPYVLPVVRCAHRLRNGMVCRAMLAPWMMHHAPRYQSGACVPRGHQAEVPMERLDALVLDVIREAYRPQALDRTLASLRTRADAPALRIRELEARVNTLKGDTDTYFDKQEKARRAGDKANSDYWDDKRAGAVRDRSVAERELATARRDAEADQGLTRAEEARARSVATRLDELLPLAAGRPAATRELVAALVRAVHVRRVGQSTFVVEVEFPGGARARRLLISRAFVASQPELAYAALRLRSYLDDEIEDRLRTDEERAESREAARAASADLNALTCGAGAAKSTWTPARVWTAAWAARFLPTPGARAGRQATVEVIARLVRSTPEAVLGAALLGRLGPAAVVGDGLRLRPDKRELHDVFPAYARRAVASASGWPLDDTVPLIDLAREQAIHPTTLRGRLRRLHALAQDAAGRLYGRRSAAEARAMRLPAFDRALATAAADIRALDVSHWRPLAQAQAELSIRPEVLYRHAPVLRARVRSVGGEARVWVWLSPEVVARIAMKRRPRKDKAQRPTAG